LPTLDVQDLSHLRPENVKGPHRKIRSRQCSELYKLQYTG
jgi:hypothetical protein